MKIKYVGHSCFVLTADDGISVVTDPFGFVGFSMPPLRADAVTVSHDHFDHNHVEGVEAPVVFRTAGEHRVGDIKISAIVCYHDEAQGRKRGKNLIFKFQMDGYTVCHLGDLGEPCEKRLVEAIAPADILLIPVGGNYTIDAREAVKYVRAVKPKIVIPMHYLTKGLQVDVAPPTDFLKWFDKKDVLYAGNEFDPHTVQDTPKIMMMERAIYAE